MAEWLDDYYGKHRYGVRFSDGQVFDPEKHDINRERDDRRYKGEGNEPMQKEDYNGSCQ